MSNTVMLKRAFNQAVATGAVRFTDADTDLLVIKTYILDYAKKNNVDISAAEVETFIKEQQKKLKSLSTKITGDGVHVDIEQISENYKPLEISKDEMLKEAFARAAANPAIAFYDKQLDFTIIKNGMEAFAKECSVEVTEQEIVDYIKKAFHEMNEAAKDFSYEFNAMK